MSNSDLNFYPVNGKIVIQPPPEEEKHGQIVTMRRQVRATTQEPEIGTIISVDKEDGEDLKHPLDDQLKPGVKVIYNNSYAMTFSPDLSNKDKKYLFMSKDNILAIYKDEA